MNDKEVFIVEVFNDRDGWKKLNSYGHVVLSEYYDTEFDSLQGAISVLRVRIAGEAINSGWDKTKDFHIYKIVNRKEMIV